MDGARRQALFVRYPKYRRIITTDTMYMGTSMFNGQCQWAVGLYTSGPSSSDNIDEYCMSSPTRSLNK